MTTTSTAQPDQPKYGISIKIPDAPPAEQLEMVNSFIEILRTLAKVSGEEAETEANLKPLLEAKVKLEAEL